MLPRGAWPTGLKSNTLLKKPNLFTLTWNPAVLEQLGGLLHRHADRVGHGDQLRTGGHLDDHGLARLERGAGARAAGR